MTTVFHNKDAKIKSGQLKPEAKQHKNWMGGESYDITNPISRLRIAASSCFFGEPMYYQEVSSDTNRKPTFAARYVATITDENYNHLRLTLGEVVPKSWKNMSPAELIESAIDDALNFDARATLKEAVRLRNEENIRTTPQVILVRAAHNKHVKGTTLISEFAPQIMSRADEPAVCLAYHRFRFGKNKIPNSLKRAWKNKLEAFGDYQLAKYKQESRGTKLVDVVNVSHPYSPSIAKLMKGELKNTDNTWEAIISKEGSSKQSWLKALPVMGHMALLRNLRNLQEHDIKPEAYIDQLINGVDGGKQLPFRYYSAYKAVEKQGNPLVLDAIEDCLRKSIDLAPKFSGKLIALADNSGSAWGTLTSSLGTMHVAEIANLTSVIAAKCSDEGKVGIFGDRLDIIPIRKHSSIFDDLKKCTASGSGIGGGTENGIWIFWRDAIKNKEHYDNVFVFSDMQAGHGGLYGQSAHEYKDYIWGGRHGRMIDVASLIKKYRKEVNKDVNVFLVQVAGYQDTIVPEFYDKTYILGGWGPGLLNFASAMSQAKFQ